MIRLLTALAVFLFSALWFLGEDHGQYIHPPRPQEDAAAAPAARPVFVPAKSTTGLPAGATPAKPAALPAVVPAAQPAVQPAVQPASETPQIGAQTGEEQSAAPATGVSLSLPQPAPEAQVIRLMRAPAGATVREGPGTRFAKLGTLKAGFVVMVLDETSAPGWTRIRTDDGGEAWVAASLLRE